MTLINDYSEQKFERLFEFLPTQYLTQMPSFKEKEYKYLQSLFDGKNPSLRLYFHFNSDCKPIKMARINIDKFLKNYDYSYNSLAVLLALYNGFHSIRLSTEEVKIKAKEEAKLKIKAIILSHIGTCLNNIPNFNLVDLKPISQINYDSIVSELLITYLNNVDKKTIALLKKKRFTVLNQERFI